MRLIAAALASTLLCLAGLAPATAWSADLYMCEIVKDGDSIAMVPAVDNEVAIDSDFRLVARSSPGKIDLRVLRNVGPAQRLLGHDTAYAATIEQSADARPLLMILRNDLTVQCRNQDPDALTWSPRALKVLTRLHGREIAGKVEGDMVGVKNSGAPQTGPAFSNDSGGSLNPLR